MGFRGEISGVFQPDFLLQLTVNMWSVVMAPNARFWAVNAGSAGGFCNKWVFSEELSKDLI